MYYFQYRIDQVHDEDYTHPKILLGVCKESFSLTQQASRAEDVWALNLATGDITSQSKMKWKEYYDVDNDELGTFEPGTIVGVLCDLQRGIISFYKDGEDLGQAFVELRVKYAGGNLFPFVETQCECELSIFHPFVYPAYRPPLPADEELPEGMDAEGWYAEAVETVDMAKEKVSGAVNDFLDQGTNIIS